MYFSYNLPICALMVSFCDIVYLKTFNSFALADKAIPRLHMIKT